MRKRLAIAVALATLILATPAIASADGDVADMLEQAASAEFHGSGVVMCTWGGDSAAATYSLTRTDGMSMIEGPGGSSMSYSGISAIRSGSDWYGTEVEAWAAWSVSDRYTMGETVETTRLGRPASMMTILEDGVPRARMILDTESTVPLLTEILDGNGDVFRMAAMVDFEPGPTDMSDHMPEVQMMDSIHPMPASTTLPDSVAGYVRVDSYDAGSGAIQAFYSDGLFSFSVFEAKRGDRPEAFDTATEFETGQHRYRRIVTPTSVWVHWDAPNRSYVLVGDLPPDHVLEVLDGLPAPGQRGFLIRFWRAIFG